MKHYKLGVKMMYLSALIDVALGLIDEGDQFFINFYNLYYTFDLR